MKTILVVDDSAICREPIAATLRLKGYQTLEAANGQEALQLAHAHKPDLLLLDVTMPVMDGLTCIGELRRHQATAKIPVIMLTATSDRAVIQQAGQMRVAGFLLKTNFSTTELINRVRSQIGEPEVGAIQQPVGSETSLEQQTVSALARTGLGAAEAKAPPPAPATRLTKSDVRQRLERELGLRSIKPIMQHVIALTRSNSSTIDDIASAIRHDQGLTLRVLRAANSSFCQRARSAKNLIEATQMIGLTAIRNMVIAILAIEHFEQETESGLIPHRFWEHSLATGVLAELIGETVSGECTDQLFLAGLLHDVGRMVLSTMFPNEYAAVIAKANEQDLDIETLEKETFELSHVDVTRHILERWKMPPSIIETASRHDMPIGELRNRKQDAKGIMTVALSNRLAHALVLGDGGNSRLLPFHDFASALCLGNEAIARITTAAIQKTTDMEMFYAAQSTQQIRGSLTIELAKRACVAPRIAVLSADTPANPFSLFFNQLGWLEAERPNTVLIHARSQIDFTKCLPALKKLDSAGRGAIAVVAVTNGGFDIVPAEWSCGRQSETLSLPCSYSRLVDAVIRCSTEAAPAKSEHSTH